MVAFGPLPRRLACIGIEQCSLFEPSQERRTKRQYPKEAGAATVGGARNDGMWDFTVIRERPVERPVPARLRSFHTFEIGLRECARLVRFRSGRFQEGKRDTCRLLA